jgi:hypothetical protein
MRAYVGSVLKLRQQRHNRLVPYIRPRYTTYVCITYFPLSCLDIDIVDVGIDVIYGIIVNPCVL